MSDSRLEKFIYAICSMDVTDLPVPLSRIEKLWNCLITGETPDFEPLSRNEKYLMAMLGRYDISNLPAPMSRGEKLLYKIAVGETDLSDVPGYLSRYEELLKYLIENGGISGGDFEYVLHTLNQSLSTLYTTAEKPVKSAILSGNTLVNISPLSGEITIKPNSNQHIESSLIKQNTIFTFMLSCTSVPSTGFIEFRQMLDGTALKTENINIVQGYNKFKVTTVNKKLNRFRFKNDSASETDFVFNNLLILEGDYTNVDIPYFEGMQSVKMPVLTTIGKNLYNLTLQDFLEGEVYGNTRKVTLKFKPNTQYTCSSTLEWNGGSASIFFNGPNSGNNGVGANNTRTATSNEQGEIFIAIVSHSLNESFFENLQIQIEEGSVATTYEPYKSNILTVNEPVELRGIGDVQDTLDCLTGEVVERVGEVVLDGSENWQEYSKNSVNTYCGVIRNDVITDYKGTVYLNNKLNKLDDSDVDIEGIRINSSKRIFVRLNRDKGITDLTTFKQYLSQNPITIQYEMITESIKTVDLTTVDQDNQPTQLRTFENLTHVSLESAGLIPEVKMEVATRISKELASASPLMDDISTKQEQLNTTVDEQSNNVDATMIATTEIYEETL